MTRPRSNFPSTPYANRRNPEQQEQEQPQPRRSAGPKSSSARPSRDRNAAPGKPSADRKRSDSGRAPMGGKPASRSAARPAAARPAAARPAAPAPRAAATDDFPISGARISRRAADRLREGHLWVYSSDIEAMEHYAEGAAPALVPVADYRGLLLGTALYSPASQIPLRLVAREHLDEAAWLELFAQRLRLAVQRRKALLNESTNACRLVFSEADQLPGLVVDCYAGLVILQLLAKGLDSEAIRACCVTVLREEMKPTTILERPDPRIRELEGLSAPSLAPLWAADAEPVTSTEFRLNGLTFQYDANSGQKTGAFLDQRLNYAAAAQWARQLGSTGRALDVCTYQGGFALHLAQVCQKVTGIDASHASLEVAERNLDANRAALSAEVDWVAGDAFEILRGWSDAGEQFDVIVLDPPAFAKSKRAIEGALRGYKELNLRALKMLRPGGLLVSCSCSHHVSLADLEASIASAAADAHRRVRLLERRGAALDHPVVLNLPETEYLKCVLLEVE